MFVCLVVILFLFSVMWLEIVELFMWFLIVELFIWFVIVDLFMWFLIVDFFYAVCDRSCLCCL